MAEYLSEHFTLEEMIASDTARARGIDNSPTEFHKKILIHTCQYLLEPLRKYLGEYYGTKVIICINSGYRSAKLNTAVGGSDTSQHCKGEAVDIRCYKYVGKIQKLIPHEELFAVIKKFVKESKISVDQCILEISGGAIWTHISHHNAGRTKDRRQFLRYNNGKYVLDCDLA